MKILLDTHALIWALSDDPGLKREARDAIKDEANSVFVSAATLWEISIKQALGKLEAPANILEAIEASRLKTLHVTAEHAVKIRDLPFHHRDPFDRMLVVQALVEGMTLVTRDGQMLRYELPVIEA